MIRSSHAILAVMLAAAAVAAQSHSTDTALYRAQGEYVGELREPAHDGKGITHGAQLIALVGKDVAGERVRLVLYRGGLPGAGWRRGDAREQVEAPMQDGEATFANGWTARLHDGVLSFTSTDGAALGELKRHERRSATLGAKAPAGAIVLFDGTTADAFAEGRLTDDRELAAGCDSKRTFADHHLHLEFKTPFQPDARGQGRGNSGVYLQGRYECQILDSFGLDGQQNECGGVYSIAEPITNACLPPATWQTYDIDFVAARFDGGQKVADARLTVHLNGILVHDDVALPHATTAAPRPEGAEPGGLYLQDHGNPVVYRNIWVIEHDHEKTRQILFLAGQKSHGYAAHEHRAGCMLLAKALNESGLNLKATVVDLWPQDPVLLDEADVIVCFADGGGGHPFVRHLGEIDALMARGKGLVCLHYAVEVPVGSPGQFLLGWLGGYFETDWSVNPHWTAEFTALPEHAITRGVRAFAIHDEWYFHMRFPPGLEAVTAILSAVAPASTMSRGDGAHSGNPAVRAAMAKGEPQHVAWTRTRADGGRAFGFTGGHVHWNWAHDDFRKVVLNAIVWCAHLPVPEGGVRSATPDLPALQANQDYEPGDGFDAATVQRLLDAFAK